MKSVPLIWFFLYCSLDYIRLWSEQDPAWWDFLHALAETGGARQYVTLFEAPFQASVLTDHENIALKAGSLMAIPPLPPGSQPLAGSLMIDLLDMNLLQWASQVQKVTSHMQLPPEAAVSCPQADIVGVLDWLEGLTRVQYCRCCFGVSQRCQCSVVPCQAPGPTTALWAPPTASYMAMASFTETTASTSATGVTPPSHLLPRAPAIEPMDMLPPLTMENLLATAGVSWGRKPQTPPWMPAAPGLRQMRPRMPQQQVPTPRGQEAAQATPYRQQVFPPKCPAPKLSTTPSASQDHGDPAGEGEGTRDRSSSQGPWGRQRRGRSSTRGSRKRQRGTPSDSLMDQMANYVASGWKRDLTNFIGCCRTAQIGSLERDEWNVAITKFLMVMAKRKAREYTDIKELTPLQFMPYVAKLFKEVTGQDLPGLGHFTGWIGQGGYYHWRVVQQGLIHLVPHLAGQPMPRTPDAHPSGKPLAPKLPPTETPSTGASGKWPDRTQPAPVGADRNPPQTRVDSSPPLAKVEWLLPPGRVESYPLHVRPVNRPPQAEVGHQQPWEVFPTIPQVREEQVMVPGLTGMRCTCARPRVGSLSLQGLPIQLGRRRRGERLSVRSMTEWMEKNRPHITSPLGPYRPTTLGSIHRP